MNSVKPRDTGKAKLGVHGQTNLIWSGQMDEKIESVGGNDNDNT